MSIYATLWTLKFPNEGDATSDCEWIAVRAQAVPPHIGTPTPGHGYEPGDPYREFLPPPVEVDAHGTAPYDRAVVLVTEHSIKGTERHPQEYAGPLLVLTGEEYARIPFAELHRRLCEIATIRPRKQWSYSGHPYLSGDLESSRLDVPALGLVPLRLEERGIWNPDGHYWGEVGEPIEEWAEPILARGPRPEFVMEQVLPGCDPASASVSYRSARASTDCCRGGASIIARSYVA